MMDMAEFRKRQSDLRRRADRQTMRSRLRARLERELRELVAEELRRAATGLAIQAASEAHPSDDASPFPMWWQK